MRLRLCTFNVENLYNRFDFAALSDETQARYVGQIKDLLGAFDGGDFTRFPEFRRLVATLRKSEDDIKRTQTAGVMAEGDAHLYVLQEVDSFEALDRFTDRFLSPATGETFDTRVLLEGNDTRGIDVAALSVSGVPVYSRSHARLMAAALGRSDSAERLLQAYPRARAQQALAALRGGRVFRRDCLELVLPLNGTEITVFACHFKSMAGGSDDAGLGVRQLEAIAVREIISRKFPDPARALWAICGDLNDARTHRIVSPHRGPDGVFAEECVALSPSGATESGIDPLLQDAFGIDLGQSLPDAERWSHYYAPARSKAQLDYIIASPALAQSLSSAPRFVRSGQPLRVPNTEGIARLDSIGWDRPKASDHCPLVVEFQI